MKRPLLIFSAGLALRLVVISYLARAAPHMLTWGSNEAGGIARWMVTNHAFSSPFHDAYGPTAWLGPVYPGVIAVLFLIFGVQSAHSALAVMCFNAICSAATGILVYEIGKESYCEGAGLLAGWMWALSPYVAILPYILWDTALSAFLLSGALVLTLRLDSSRPLGQWIACGAAWGVAALVNPALLIPLPAVAWLRTDRDRWKQVLVLTAFTGLMIVPWTIRNYIVFRQIIPIRSNGLAEIYFANCGFATHPLGPSMQYQNLGEAAFTAQTGRAAVEYVRAHPGTFLLNSFRRVPSFWLNPINFWPLSLLIDLGAIAGLFAVSKKSKRIALPIAAVLTVYPLIYYASQVVSRYRHPIDPVLYALSGVALWQVWTDFDRFLEARRQASR